MTIENNNSNTSLIDEDLIVNLYNSGLSVKKVADKLQISYSLVKNILKSKNIKRGIIYISDLTKEQKEEIVQKYQNKQTIASLAKWYEISPQSIKKILTFANIKLPENVECQRKYDIIRETPLNKIQKEFLVGKLLGDGCLSKFSKSGNFFFSFSHSIKQSKYFEWCSIMMDPFLTVSRKNIDKRGNSIMLQTKTATHQELNKFGNLFYNSQTRIKYIPNDLDMYLTPLALAVWIMDDGNLNAGVNMRIATMGFNYEDHQKLQTYLKRCYNLNSKIMEFKMKGKLYWQITLNKENTQKLSDIIRPYIIDSMKYKIMPEIKKEIENLSKPSTTTCLALENKNQDNIDNNSKDDIV